MKSIDPSVFAMYVHWLYHGTIAVLRGEAGSDSADPKAAHAIACAEYQMLVDAYILGDKILDSGFRNATMDAIVEKSTLPTQDGRRFYPRFSTIRHIYKHTLASAPIRSLLVDMFVRHGRSAWLPKPSQTFDDDSSLPVGFLMEVTSKLFDERGASYWSLSPPIDSSKYHFQMPAGEKE